MIYSDGMPVEVFRLALSRILVFSPL